MSSLDETDRNILYELGANARRGYKEIAGSIKSKKSVVAYRVQKMQDEGVITKYVPVFSLSRLGIYAYKIYVKFHGLSKNEKTKLLEDLVADKHINWVASSVGSWDLLFSTYAHTVSDFAKRKNAFFGKYGQYIQEYEVTILEDALVFNRDYLLKKPLSYRKEFVFSGKNELLQIDETQKQIMRLIRNDGRYQVSDIAHRLELNVKTIMSKIKDLESRGILQGFTTFVDLPQLQVQFCKLCLYLQDFDERKYQKLIEFAKSDKHVVHIIKSIGSWDLEIELEVSELESMYAFIEKCQTQFPHLIKKIDTVIITKEHKLEFFPAWY